MNFDYVLKWSSTALLIFGAVLTSFNIYPANVVLSFAGNVGWLIAGIKMREASLWVVSLALIVIYLFGLFYSIFFV